MGSTHYREIYVDGRWVASTGTDTIAVVNPATEEVIAEVTAGTPADVDAAAKAARAAFDEWGSMPPAERSKYLVRIAEALEPRAEEIAELECAEVGTPLEMARRVHAQGPIANFKFIAELAEGFPWEERMGGAIVVRAPVGVVGQITPWNFPLNQVVQKVAPALLAGCTVLLKPSEVAPLTAFIMAEAIDEVGLPPGVFNLLSGVGPVVGEAIASHPEVDMVSFTGSTRAGKRVAELASESVKRVALEMGGKSANIILDDADLEKALPASVMGCFFNSGQVCVALSRLLVPRDRHDEIVERVKAIAEATTVGDPTTDVALGPVVSEVQRDRVRSYIQKGVDEGATLVTGGVEQPDGLDTGFYVRPTVFAGVDNDMTIAREEIFGPVLSIIPYDDEDDAVRIANDTIYGLSGAVWAGDKQRGEKVARRLRTGMVRVNEGGHAQGTPFGGFKQSGIGRESGRFGLDEYVELQTLSVGD